MDGDGVMLGEDTGTEFGRAHVKMICQGRLFVLCGDRQQV
jgi:hypothetical protein